MTVQQFLDIAQVQLDEAGVTTSRLDVLVLMEDVIGKNRAQLLAYPEQELTQNQIDKLQKLINQRALHVPLAYVRGKTEFYGREFAITSAVLEPRPESETMIDLLKKLAIQIQTESGEDKTNNSIGIIDVGTGAGALGITAALEISGSHVTLTDIDGAALEVAIQNCKRFGLDLPCITDNLLSHAAKRGAKFDVALANLPYVPNNHIINAAAMHEPRLAIFGGPDGLDIYRTMFEQLKALQIKYVFTESLPFQHQELEKIAKAHGYKQQIEQDFIQLFTVT